MYQHTDPVIFLWALTALWYDGPLLWHHHGAITPILGEKRAAVVSGLVQASAGIGDALMSPALNLAISRFDIAVAMQA